MKGTIVNKTLDLHYSPDENEWYFQDYASDRVSVSYSSKREAMDALENKTIEWEE